MTTILNLTQHLTTSDQIELGVVEPKDKGKVQSIITFDSLPNHAELVERANLLAQYALSENAESVMIGGAPYFSSYVEQAMRYAGIKALYAFSKRECVEVEQEDGFVVKTFVFKHEGFIEVS